MHLSAEERRAHLRALAKAEGFADIAAMLEATVHDCVAPAICLACGFISEMEPDQDRGYCERCAENKVVSALILAGLI
jgi:hypothetical protein